MSVQLQEIADLLRQRLSVVQQLAAANAEHHRLLQLSGGADFLTPHATDERDEGKRQDPAAPALEANAALMDDLHVKLEQIDKLIEKNKYEGEAS